VNVRRNFVSTYATLQETSGLVTFNSMTDFVNGVLTPAGGDTYTQNFANVGAEPLSMYSLGFYVQDEWKARPNLTFTLTMRFDRNSNIHCYSNCFNELSGPFASIGHSASTPYNQTIQTGIGEAFPGLESIVPEPRIGVAYSISRSTVIRGGFGIFSDLYQALIADRFITNAPAVSSFTTMSGLVASNNPNSIFAAVANSNAAFQSGFANGANLSQLQASVPLGFSVPNFSTIAKNLSNPKYYEWNVEVQQSIGNNYMVSLNYVGNHGTDILNQNLWTNAYTKPGFVIPGVATSAPDPRFGEIRELNNGSYSNYDGLVASFKWRLGSQFSGQFAYTFSHSLDTCSNECLEPFNALASAPSIRSQLSPFGPSALNYSNSDYDVRHTIGANYVYTVPNSYFRNSVLKAVLGNWTLAGTFLYHGGYPFSVVNTGVRSAQLNNVTGPLNEVILSDWLGGTSLPSCTTPNVQCLTTSQFATSTSQRDLGNLPRNSFRGPGYFDTDLNVNKSFAYRERLKLTVGANLFNVLNHPNFDLPVNSVTNGAFGQIIESVAAPTSAYGSFQGSAVSGRVIQTFVKFAF
jgi:hypothetical protein